MTENRASDRAFVGSIPEVYDEILVPMIFAGYATDLAARAAAVLSAADGSADVLELAAGTGALTRQLATRLPATATITATDLNPPMLAHAAAIGTERPVVWQQADAMSLPFPDESMDVVTCQFGVMFFPDRTLAYREARRVLRPGGTLLFNVWRGLEDNEFPAVVDEALRPLFGDEPSTFVARVPHGYHDPSMIAGDLAAAGFGTSPRFETIDARSRCASARAVAIGFCHGTPIRNEIVRRDPALLDEATDRAAAAIERRFGATDVDGRVSATVVTVAAV